MSDKEKGILDPMTPWQEAAPGGAVYVSGNAQYYVTGGWRANTPVWDTEKCKNCILCFPVCPDSSIIVEDGKMVGIDYDHCKGCGVCANTCAFGALSMKVGGIV